MSESVIFLQYYSGPWVSTSFLVILSGGCLTGRIMFALNWPFTRRYRRYQSTRGWGESRWQPAPSAGEWPTAARQPPPTTRSTPTARRERTAPEKETSPPAPQTLEINTPDNITVTRPSKTAQLTPSPYIQNQLHRLLLQRLHVLRDLEQSRRSTQLNSRHSISMST